MRLPKLDHLIGEQLAVYEHAPDQHLFVAGPPGSGKTTLAVLRSRFLMDFGHQTVLLTKNRMLAALASQLGGGDIRTMTMHRFVWKDHHGKHVPQSYPYHFDWNEIIKTYEAAAREPVLDHLVIDEGQNLPREFFKWAIRFAARTISVFADEDQTTDPSRASLADICDAGLPNPVRLQANHRNTYEIARVAEHFHRSAVLPPAIVQRARGGETPRLVRINTWDEGVNLIATRYRNRGGSIGLVVYRIQEVMDLQRRIAAVLPGGRVDAYTSDMAPSAAAAIRMLEPGITVLTSESVIGLEFDAVYLQDLARSLPPARVDDFRRMYMLCARARDTLTLLDGPAQLNPNQVASLPPPEFLER